MSPKHWAEVAAVNQLRIVNEDGSTPLRYRVHKVDAKGDVTREVIEAREGTVARMVLRNGQPLSPAEDAAERDRLQEVLRSPEAFLKKTHREQGSRSYASDLLKEMPRAMQWSYAPGQPQLSDVHGTQVVLDFKPDPAYKPPTLIAQALTGIAGRVWIDTTTQCVLRIEGDILHPVDFGWGGVLARIREGGHIRFEQRQAAPGRWLYSQLDEHITIREVLVRTVEENVRLSAGEVRPLPAPVCYRDAIAQLLALPVQVR